MYIYDEKINLITDFAYFCECIGTPTNNVLDLQASILSVSLALGPVLQQLQIKSTRARAIGRSRLTACAWFSLPVVSTSFSEASHTML